MTCVQVETERAWLAANASFPNLDVGVIDWSCDAGFIVLHGNLLFPPYSESLIVII